MILSYLHMICPYLSTFFLIFLLFPFSLFSFFPFLLSFFCSFLLSLFNPSYLLMVPFVLHHCLTLSIFFGGGIGMLISG